MTLNEMIKLFLDSRKRGMSGARKKCTDNTIKIYRCNLELWQKFMSEELGVSAYTDVKRVGIIAFSEWMDNRQKKGEWSRSTVLQHLRSLKALFRWVDADEDCREAGLKGVQRWLPTIEKNPRRLDIPQLSAMKRFRNTFNTSNIWHYRDYVATCLLSTNGIRIGELCNLLISHTRLEEKTLIVDGKTGPRVVPLTKEMIGLLKGWLKRRQGCRFASSPYVFVSRRGDKMQPSGFGHAFLKHRKKYGLEKISAHSFRHVFCTNYLKNGGQLERLRQITGHQSYDMLKDYLHLAQVGGKEAHEELERVNLLKDM